MTREERHIAVLNRMLENMEVFDSIKPTEERKRAIEEAIKVLKQQPILDKIKEEIMQLYYEVEVVDYDHNDVLRIKKAHWIKREEVLQIIDKYRGEADCHSCKTEYDCYECKKYTESEERHDTNK